jgi:hypothetical protein
MTITSTILCSFILTLFSCGQTTEKSSQSYNESRELVPNPEGHKKDTSYFTSSDTTTLDYIIFGIYCGECGNHCATMYQYNAGGNSNTLLVDSSDSYFKNYGKIKFDKAVNDTRRFYLAQSIFKQIPTELLTTTKLTASFGCSDCTDGCGIYFEFKQGSKVKKFYIDYQTSQLTTDIKKFAEYLKTTIGQINDKT